jgi:hypothetical protein
MLEINRRSIIKSSAATVAAASLPKLSRAQAAFTPPNNYTPDDLKGNMLTPFGSLRAGNADGSIPAWTGGGYPMPEGYQQGDPRPIPFADEKPVVVITSANMAQYADKLSAAVQAMLQKYPDYSVQVFPTHRTAIAPQYVYDYIYKNASNAQLTDDGNAITGAYGGIPFPFPKNGAEVIWNHELVWNAVSVYFVSDAYTITAVGEVVLDSRVHGWFQWPYYIENGEDRFTGFYQGTEGVPIAPPYEAGASILFLGPVNPTLNPFEGWEYLEGERRVRRAPELQFDTPNSLAGGVSNWDEADIFSGQLIEYDFVWTGTKELYVPYNSNKATYATIQEQFLPHFFNPDLTRWELHRVRVVEMTVKPGSRNVDAKRIIYCDEDTGSALVGEVYDANGSLWKLLHNMPCIYGDVPALVTIQNFMVYDLHAGNYSSGDIYNNGTQPQFKVIPELPASFFTPGQLSASAGGF